jgi:hypothetical protein
VYAFIGRCIVVCIGTCIIPVLHSLTVRWDCILEHFIVGKIEGRVEVMGRRRRRRIRHKQLLNYLMEKSGFQKLKEKALDRPLWWTAFGLVYWLVARQAYLRTYLLTLLYLLTYILTYITYLRTYLLTYFTYYLRNFTYLLTLLYLLTYLITY